MLTASKAISPAEFAAAVTHIVETMSGHEAHRALDTLSNQTLSALGYGEGVSLFLEAASKWHPQGES